LREAIAKQEYDNHQVQVANARQIVDFLHGNDPGPILPTTDQGDHHRLLRFSEARHQGALRQSLRVGV
jgi:hypothetical protein